MMIDLLYVIGLALFMLVYFIFDKMIKIPCSFWIPEYYLNPYQKLDYKIFEDIYKQDLTVEKNSI